MSQEFLTVSALNSLIQEVLQMGFPQAVWVCGEIQGFNRNRDKKHVFFELCEKDIKTKDIVARVGLVIFSGKKIYIEEVLADAQNAFPLKDDIEVKFLCRIDFYPPHGALRLIVENIDPTYTLGKIAQAKQKLIAELKSKGVLDANKQLAFPQVPLNIGLITAYDSAAYHDFVSELRLSGYGFKIFCRNTLMQGSRAEADVCRALDELSTVDDLDVLVITRGGGSIAELSCFDSESIAKKIAQMPIVVLSGIGHEINLTITDLAAHTQQKTPTAIAGFLVDKVRGFLDDARQRLGILTDLAQRHLSDENQNLKDQAYQLQRRTQQYFKIHLETMVRYSEIVRKSPPRQFRQRMNDLENRKSNFTQSVLNRFQKEQKRLQHFCRLVEMAHPKNALKRGFSITRSIDGKALKSIKQLEAGQVLHTEVNDGVFHSEVKDLKKEAGRGRREIQ